MKYEQTDPQLEFKYNTAISCSNFDILETILKAKQHEKVTKIETKLYNYQLKMLSQF